MQNQSDLYQMEAQLFLNSKLMGVLIAQQSAVMLHEVKYAF